MSGRTSTRLGTLGRSGEEQDVEHSMFTVRRISSQKTHGYAVRVEQDLRAGSISRKGARGTGSEVQIIEELDWSKEGFSSPCRAVS